MIRPSLCEIDRIDWGSLTCGCLRSARHLGEDLRAIITAENANEANSVQLVDHVEYGTVLNEASPYAVTVMIAALGEDLHPISRSKILDSIFKALCGEGDGWLEGVPTAACAKAAFSGIWQFYREALEGDSETAFDILEIIESDSGRINYFRRRVDEDSRKKKNK